MKKILLLTLLLLGKITFSQQFTNLCQEFESYKQMLQTQANFLAVDFEQDPIMAFGNTIEEAKYKAKIMTIKKIMYNEVLLNNPIVDSILSEFAGEIIKFDKDNITVGKTPKKYKKQGFGKFSALVTKVTYNKKATEFLKEKIDYFLKSQVIFIINPNVNEYADPLTKQIYNDARQKFLSALGASRYKLDGIKETRMFEIEQLPAKPQNYSPCSMDFRFYKTGNKYLDYILALINNPNRTINVDFIFTIDTITITKTPDNQKRVNIHILAIDAHNASIVMVYDLYENFQPTLPDIECVKNAINTTFSKNTDAIMYELIKRYSNYIRDGVEFSLLICNELISENENLEYNITTCNLFVKGSVKPNEWRDSGISIGKNYTGRTYAIDPLLFKTAITQLLKNSGINNFKIDIAGMTFVVTKK